MAEKDRIRTKELRVKLSDLEYERLNRIAAEVGLPFSNIIRSFINFGKVEAFWLDEVSLASVNALNEAFETFQKDFLYQIERIGNNVNQIAYNTNVTFNTEVDELRQTFSNLIDAEKAILEKLSELQNMVTEFELKGMVTK